MPDPTLWSAIAQKTGDESSGLQWDLHTCWISGTLA
jgi:hypothetical protein